MARYFSFDSNIANFTAELRSGGAAIADLDKYIEDKWHKAKLIDSDSDEYEIFVSKSNVGKLLIAAKYFGKKPPEKTFQYDFVDGDPANIEFKKGGHEIVGKDFIIVFDLSKNETYVPFIFNTNGADELEADVGINADEDASGDNKEEAPPARKKRAPEEEVPDKIVVVTLQVIGARIKSIEDITIKIVGRESNDDEDSGAGSIDIPLRKAPAEDKTSVIKSVKTEASNIDFFTNFAGEYVNVMITATSAATGGKMTITKEFKVPKRIVSDSSYLLQFNFAESAIRAKDATQGVPVIFGSRGAINFNKKPGTVQYIYYTKQGDLNAVMVETSVTASGKTYEFFFDSEPLLVPVRIPQDAIKGIKKESRQGRRNLLKEADGPQEHWILLLGKAQDGSGAAPDMGSAAGGSPRDGDGGDDDGGSSVVAANVALRYVKFTTQEKYVILPNYKIDLAGSAFALATDLEGAPEDRSERTLTRGMVDEDDIREAVYKALFKTSDEYKQMSGQFSDNLSPAAQRSIVKCWVEGPTVSGFRGVTAREESRYRG